MATNVEIEKAPTSQMAEAERTRSGRVYRPAVDIVEKSDELLLIADMPGTRSEDVDIRFENGTLAVYGKVNERQPEDTGYLLREYGTGDFYRTFLVNETIDPERISAEYRDGVLIVHLPKVEAAKPRKIQVLGPNEARGQGQ
jgi:HSP20 family protein